MNTHAWLDGFLAGTLRKLGAAPGDMDGPSWMAGYFEGIDPAAIYFVEMVGGDFQIERFDPKEGEPYPVEQGSFRTRRQAEQFLTRLGQLMKFSHVLQMQRTTPLLTYCDTKH